jgi:hypothetical protein
VDHIDLRACLGKPGDEPVFAETDERQKDGFRHLNPVEVPAPNPGIEKISLTLAAFPGVTIRHSIRASGAAGGSFAGARRRTRRRRHGRASNSVAETYGITAAVFTEINKYCSVIEQACCLYRWVHASRNCFFVVTDRGPNTILLREIISII